MRKNYSNIIYYVSEYKHISIDDTEYFLKTFIYKYVKSITNIINDFLKSTNIEMCVFVESNDNVDITIAINKIKKMTDI